MTCKEKLALEHPELRDLRIPEVGCPHNYGYLPIPDGCGECGWEGITCSACWDREIPKLGIPLDDISESHIKDSGDRTLFDTGAVRDMREGKGRCDLMPLEVVSTLMHDLTFNELKLFLDTKDTACLYRCLDAFSKAWDDGKTRASMNEIRNQRHTTMLLEVAKHFEEGAKKYGENNWQKGIPVHCYIDSAVRHYLKWLRGDKDEPHDRAFVWNLMCCIWEVDYRTEGKTEGRGATSTGKKEGDHV
jgi:hypothetical protein